MHLFPLKPTQTIGAMIAAVNTEIVTNNNNSMRVGIILEVGNIPEKEMATHSSVLAWRILWTEEPGGLPSMGLHICGDTTEAT